MKELEGRELDEKMAELMGWIKTDSNLFVSPPTGRVYAVSKFWNDEDELKKEIETIGKLLHVSNMFKLWQPSRDIAAAWLVVEKLVEMGFYVDIGVDKHGAQVQLNHYTGSEYGWIHGKSIRGKDAPEAICRAALMAAEAE